MTDENQVKDQEVELHDDNDVVEEAHDPKNAEAQSVASLNKADDASPKAPARKGDSTKQDPMPKLKTKAAMMSAAVGAMQGMSKEKLSGVLATISSGTDETAFDGQPITEEEKSDELKNVEYDFSNDLEALVNEEATLSDGFKEKAGTIFEAAIKSKLTEEINRLEKSYQEELNQEIEATQNDMVEKVDNYLNYVVENWMKDNKVAIQTGLRTEIAEEFMGKLKDLFTESYIEVPDSKVDLVDDLSDQVEELETNLNKATEDAISMQEELEGYKRDAIIREASRDLTDTQVDKLKSLVEKVDFDDEESFAKKVSQLKESYFKKAKTGTPEIEESDESDDIIETSDSMSKYLTALKQTNKR